MNPRTPTAAHRAGHGQEQTMLESPERQALRAALVQLDAAEQAGRPYDMSVALVRVGRAYRRLNALRAAEDSLQQALRWAGGSGSIDHEVDLLCELAECAVQLAEQLGEAEFRGAHAARDRARDAAFEASTLARRVADAGFERVALLRASDVLSRCGDHDDAARLQSCALGTSLGGSGQG